MKLTTSSVEVGPDENTANKNRQLVSPPALLSSELSRVLGNSFFFFTRQKVALNITVPSRSLIHQSVTIADANLQRTRQRLTLVSRLGLTDVTTDEVVCLHDDRDMLAQART